MRKGMMLALFLATAAIGPAAAQQPTNTRADNARGGIPTETQSRLAGGISYDLIWNLLGLFGLLGLLGLKKEHSDDSYHPAPLE